MIESCTLTYLGTGECSVCRLSLKPMIGQELRQGHTNSSGKYCASCCVVCRHVGLIPVEEIPSAEFSDGDGW